MANRDLFKAYPYQKPSVSIQLILIGCIAVSGLLALFIAAYHAFLLVAAPPQAFFAALVIEAGLIVEALALISKPKTLPPWIGLIISYIVSGTYNFTQAAQAGGEFLGIWELVALAFGPLSALAVVSLTFGNELRAYQDRVGQWEQNRADWVEGERIRLEEIQQQREREREELEARTRQEQRELEAKQRQERLLAEQKHAEKMARIAAKNSTKLTRNNFTKKRISKDERLDISLDLIRKYPRISGAELGRQLNISDRSGQLILNELVQNKVIYRNGEGWKIIESSVN